MRAHGSTAYLVLGCSTATAIPSLPCHAIQTTPHSTVRTCITCTPRSVSFFCTYPDLPSSFFPVFLSRRSNSHPGLLLSPSSSPPLLFFSLRPAHLSSPSPRHTYSPESCPVISLLASTAAALNHPPPPSTSTRESLPHLNRLSRIHAHLGPPHSPPRPPPLPSPRPLPCSDQDLLLSTHPSTHPLLSDPSSSSSSISSSSSSNKQHAVRLCLIAAIFPAHQGLWPVCSLAPAPAKTTTNPDDFAPPQILTCTLRTLT